MPVVCNGIKSDLWNACLIHLAYVVKVIKTTRLGTRKNYSSGQVARSLLGEDKHLLPLCITQEPSRPPTLPVPDQCSICWFSCHPSAWCLWQQPNFWEVETFYFKLTLLSPRSWAVTDLMDLKAWLSPHLSSGWLRRDVQPLCITFCADKTRKNSISHQEAVWDALGTGAGLGTPVL